MLLLGRPVLACALALLPAVGGCAGDGAEPPVEPPISEGKTDVADRTDPRGELPVGGEVLGQLVEDLEFHAYTLDVRAGAVVTLDVTQRGSSRSLDSSLFVYGPMSEGGAFGTDAIAFDDDAGWGKLSRLTDLALTDGGRYLVVVGSHDGRGRGNYRLIASCAGECAPIQPAGECNAVIADDIRACVVDLIENAEDVPPTELDAIEQCADAEPVADAFDEVCAGAEPPAFCQGTYEEFALGHLPGCIAELQGEVLDRTCVFGTTFRELRDSPVLHPVRDRRRIDSPDGLTALDRDQIVLAVQASSNTDVDSVEEALDRVDQNVIDQYERWDGTNRRAFTVYEYGAGDNSYGRVFAQGTTDTLALIGDGDIRDCTLLFGPEGRTCSADAQCADGLTCTGIASPTGRGMCVDLDADQSPDEGSTCTAEDDCALGSGLSCAGLTRADEGLCLPAWQRRHFGTEQPTDIPDGSTDGASTSLIASGLATVDTDVVIQANLFHEDVSQLKVTLTNPAGTEVIIADHDRTGPELILDEAVLGFSGDEPVNGLWTLKVIDDVTGTVGTIDRWSLRIGSRQD